MSQLFGLLLIILGYFSGSICSAILVCRICGLPDPREGGSKNPGATNVLRLHGKKYAAMVFVGDMLKGTIPVLIGHLFGLSPAYLGWISLACVLGHVFPVFFEFKGGKGVATALGCYFGINFLFGVMCLLVWMFMVLWKRYSSLASITMVLAAPFISMFMVHIHALFVPLLAISALILFKHKENIERLMKGEESLVKF